MFKQLIGVLALLVLLTIALHDSRIHFDVDLVALKRQHDSPQRHWNLFYAQKNVYENSSIRYANDLSKISSLIEDDSIVLSDRATSYYLAAETSAFVKNVHGHHGGGREVRWKRLIDKQYACFPDRPELLQKFLEVVASPNYTFHNEKSVMFYLAVNSDTNNRNMDKECLVARHGTLNKEYKEHLSLLFQGEFLTLYELSEPN